MESYSYLHLQLLFLIIGWFFSFIIYCHFFHKLRFFFIGLPFFHNYDFFHKVAISFIKLWIVFFIRDFFLVISYFNYAFYFCFILFSWATDFLKEMKIYIIAIHDVFCKNILFSAIYDQHSWDNNINRWFTRILVNEIIILTHALHEYYDI